MRASMKKAEEISIMKRSRAILLAALLFATAAAAPASDAGSSRGQAMAPARDPVAAQGV